MIYENIIKEDNVDGDNGKLFSVDVENLFNLIETSCNYDESIEFIDNIKKLIDRKTSVNIEEDGTLKTGNVLSTIDITGNISNIEINGINYSIVDEEDNIINFEDLVIPCTIIYDNIINKFRLLDDIVSTGEVIYDNTPIVNTFDDVTIQNTRIIVDDETILIGNDNENEYIIYLNVDEFKFTNGNSFLYTRIDPNTIEIATSNPISLTNIITNGIISFEDQATPLSLLDDNIEIGGYFKPSSIMGDVIGSTPDSMVSINGGDTTFKGIVLNNEVTNPFNGINEYSEINTGTLENISQLGEYSYSDYASNVPDYISKLDLNFIVAGKTGLEYPVTTTTAPLLAYDKSTNLNDQTVEEFTEDEGTLLRLVINDVDSNVDILDTIIANPKYLTIVVTDGTVEGTVTYGDILHSVVDNNNGIVDRFVEYRKLTCIGNKIDVSGSETMPNTGKYGNVELEYNVRIVKANLLTREILSDSNSTWSSSFMKAGLCDYNLSTSVHDNSEMFSLAPFVEVYKNDKDFYVSPIKIHPYNVDTLQIFNTPTAYVVGSGSEIEGHVAYTAFWTPKQESSAIQNNFNSANNLPNLDAPTTIVPKPVTFVRSGLGADGKTHAINNINNLRGLLSLDKYEDNNVNALTGDSFFLDQCGVYSNFIAGYRGGFGMVEFRSNYSNTIQHAEIRCAGVSKYFGTTPVPRITLDDLTYKSVRARGAIGRYATVDQSAGSIYFNTDYGSVVDPTTTSLNHDSMFRLACMNFNPDFLYCRDRIEGSEGSTILLESYGRYREWSTTGTGGYEPYTDGSDTLPINSYLYSIPIGVGSTNATSQAGATVIIFRKNDGRVHTLTKLGFRDRQYIGGVLQIDEFTTDGFHFITKTGVTMVTTRHKNRGNNGVFAASAYSEITVD